MVKFNVYETVGWWIINGITWNIIDRESYVLSTDINDKDFVADHSLVFMKGGLFCEMAS